MDFLRTTWEFSFDKYAELTRALQTRIYYTADSQVIFLVEPSLLSGGTGFLATYSQ